MTGTRSLEVRGTGQEELGIFRDEATTMSKFTICGLTLLSLAVAHPILVSAQDEHDLLLREIYQELVEIDTSPSGSTAPAAEALAARLSREGFPEEDVHVLGNRPERSNLVARLRGRGTQPPILLLAHLDVVEALREDWTYDPFTLSEIGGYFYGRGTLDDKSMCAIWIANLIRLKREGWMPDRDIIVALTAGEEQGAGADNGAQWLLANRRDLIDAEFVLNEGGGGQIRDGVHMANTVQASEKVYQSYTLEVTNPGGHSSVPSRDNAIYHLAGGLARLAGHEFPVVLNEVTREYFRRMSDLENGQTASDMRALIQDGEPDESAIERLSAIPVYNARIRTTCVATQLQAGHAENALPQTARATVNCRVLPGLPVEEVRATLVRVLDDPEITVAPVAEATASPPSPLAPELLEPIQGLTEEFWPGVPVVPEMSSGATDGLFFRNAGIPVYGVDGIFVDMDDNRIHGMDERVGVRELYEAREFLFRLVTALAGPPRE